jgi:hypothetical protein
LQIILCSERHYKCRSAGVSNGVPEGDPSETEMPYFSPDDAGTYTGFMTSGELKDYTYNSFPGSADYVEDVICGGEQALPAKLIKKGYHIVNDQIINPDNEPVAAISFRAHNFLRSRGKIQISSDFKDYTGYLYPVTGHEAINCFHYASGFMALYGADASEYIAHSWSAKAFCSDIYSNWSASEMNRFLSQSIGKLGFDWTTCPQDGWYPSFYH